MLFICITMSFAARKLERLDRGLVAVKVTNGVFLSWRVLGTDAASTAFNIYRGTTKVNAAPITGATNLVDATGTTSSTYSVRPIVNNVEQPAEETVKVLTNFWKSFPVSAPPVNSLPGGSSYTYNIADGSTGDLDGDGKLDLVFLWNPSNMKDNSLSGYTGDVWMDGYTMEGKRLFRIDLGKNIRAGCHYTQFVVADFDVDGKAEIMVKTAPGTKDGSGAFLGKGVAAGADHSKDYRNSKGYILTGPEWLTVFRGTDGKELATVDYNPGRGTVSSWGDSYGNRVDRFLATAAWLDGVKPSGVFQRGYYTRMAITAWDWNGTALSQKWYYNAASSGKECYGQGNHSLTVGDVDGDKKDEIIQGACAINDDGSFMYRTGLGHGDAMHLGDLDPDHAGLEVYEVHEEKTASYGYEMHDAKTGEILWGVKTSTDNGRGVAADVDAATRGYESWSFASGVLQTAKGVNTSIGRNVINFRVYWDGDLLDEVMEHEAVNKLVNGKWTQLLALNNQGVHANDGNKYTPCLSADLLGDWREEIVMGSTAMDSIKIFTTTELTAYRLYTLMHDPVYRTAISWQNAAYNQPPHPGFWLAGGPGTWPTPDIELVGSTQAPTLAKTGIGSENQIVLVNDTIESFSYMFSNCNGASTSGLPAGVSADIDVATYSLKISGKPTAAGTFPFTVTTAGGSGTPFVMSGTFTVIPKATVVALPTTLQSQVNSAYPFEGLGVYEEKNVGWIDSGYYNFTNSADSYAQWKLNSTSEATGATIVIRFANGGLTPRHMDLLLNGTSLGAVPFAKTTDWTTYESVSLSINLAKGVNTLRLNSIGSDGGPNIDEFSFDLAGVTLYKDSVDTTANEEPTHAYPPLVYSTRVSYDPTTGIITSPSSGHAVLEAYNIQGNRIAYLEEEIESGSSRFAFPEQSLPKGMLLLRVKVNGIQVGTYRVE